MILGSKRLVTTGLEQGVCPNFLPGLGLVKGGSHSSESHLRLWVLYNGSGCTVGSNEVSMFHLL